METEGLNFIESVDKLANLAGLEVPKQDPIERARGSPKDVKEVLKKLQFISRSF